MPKKDVTELPNMPMFGDRDTVKEAIEYGTDLSEADGNPAVLISMFVLFNTIAKNYYLIPKEDV